MAFEPIAILGRGCVLPGALSPDALWTAIEQGRDLTSDPEPEDWGLPPSSVIAPPQQGAQIDKTWGGRGGYVRGFEDAWDPEGFAVSFAELDDLDKGVLWLLHAARQAWIEGQGDAFDPARVGAVIGNLSYPSRGLSNFAHAVWRNARDHAGFRPENRFVSGFPAHLLARAFGLGGPAFALDAACASSLYAIKHACDLLHARQTDAMLVGAVNACDNLFLHMGFTALGALSRSGRSSPLSRSADGLLPAEGAAAVLLVRACDVDPARDNVLGVIRGVGVSNDGKRRGLLAPDGGGQREALERAYGAAGLAPQTVSLVECHATGTPTGDPLEVATLAEVFADAPDLPVGSLKSNTGHLITAAGLGGLLKLLGALERGTRPPTIHAEDSLPIFEQGPVRPLLAAEDWPRAATPRRAGLSAFGFGGNNAHLVLEEWTPDRRPAFMPARTPDPDTDDIVICGVGASAGDVEGLAAILASLEAPPPDAPRIQREARSQAPRPRREAVTVDLARVKHPPRDLDRALAQQLWLFEVVDEALSTLSVDKIARERIGVFVGMGCDAEAARWTLRWREAASQADKDGVVAPLDAAAVLGAMPNIPANRLNAVFDWRGVGHTVSSEEASGLDALMLAARALSNGELDLAIVGAADLSDEPVHAAAARSLGLPRPPGDAAAALVLKRRADAERDGDPILASVRLGGGSPDATDHAVADALASRFGVAHAASSLLALGVAAAAGARRRRIEDGRAWFAAAPRSSLTFDNFTGRRIAIELTHDARPRPSAPHATQPMKRAARPSPASPPLGGEVALMFTGAAAAYTHMGRSVFAAFPAALDRVAARFGEADDTARRLATDPDMLKSPFEQLRATTLLSQVHAEIAFSLLKTPPTAAIGLSSGETNSLLAFRAWRDPDALLDDVRASEMYERWLAGRFETAREAWGETGAVVWRNWRVLAPLENVRRAVADEPRASITIVHGPNDCVIGGAADACTRTLERVGPGGAMPLGQDMIVHCAELAPFEETWREIHSRATFAAPGVRFYANATNAAYDLSRANAAQMITAQAAAPIDVSKTILQAWEDGVRVFIEMGPRDTLARAADAVLGERPHLAVAFDRFGVDGLAQIDAACAALAAAGVEVDTEALDALFAQLAADAAPHPEPRAPHVVAAHPPPVRPPGGAAQRVAQFAQERPVEAASIETPDVAVMARAPALAAVSRRIEPLRMAAGGGAGALAPAPALQPVLRSARVAPPVAPPVAKPPAPTPSTTAKDPSGPRPPTGPAFDRAQLEAAARGKVSELFGPLFKRQDGFRRQVRMPAPPLLLADRVTGVDAEPGVQGKGTIWTETDVAADAWHLHLGRMRPGIVIESGQADLLLASYMGVDFLNQDERVYRLLGCELTFREGGPPRAGETLKFQINIDQHAALKDTRLFFFNYDACAADGEGTERPILSVRNGQAGFFSDQELAESGGVIWDPDNAKPPTAKPRLASLARASAKRAFSTADLDAWFAGDAYRCFGKGFEFAAAHQRTPRPPSGRMRMIDSVEAFEPTGGPWGRGYLRAAAAAPRDAWYYEGHFHNDPCMPGTLMAEAAVQAVETFMTAAGLAIDRDGWRFEPATEEAFKFVCRGQVVPDGDHRLTYEVFVDEIVDSPEPTVYAALLAKRDGFKVFYCPRFGVRLSRDWPITDRPEATLLDAAPRVVSPPGTPPVRGDLGALLACAWGRPSDAFGPMYARFDRESSVPRLPGPPYHAVSRILSVSASPGEPRVGARVVAEFEPTEDAWFFDDNASAVMPLSVLMEALLQPCGWLASYCGFAREGGLKFRNLDGAKAVARGEVRPDGAPLRIETTLTRWSTVGALTIVFFDVVCTQSGAPVMDFSTSFGFFAADVFANQAGLPTTDDDRARLTETSDAALLAGAAKRRDRARVPRGKLKMIDAVTGFWPTGGEAGLGRIRGRQLVDPSAWYFKAHFYEDPVQPGSLGVDALLQLLEHALRNKGLDRDFINPRFEAPALGAEMTWKYRGQVTPDKKEVVTTLDITALNVKPREVFATAKASLWVDGLRIYEVEGLSARIVEGAIPPIKGVRLNPVNTPWLNDHRPTYTVAALPMMGAVKFAASTALEHAKRPFPFLLEDFVLSRWILAGEADVGVDARAAPRGAGRYDLELFADGALVGTGRARAGLAAAPAHAPNADDIGDPTPVADLYQSGALFHGPAFHLLTDVQRSPRGATARLDMGRAFDPEAELDVGLLDALLHAVPHDAPELWFGARAAGKAGYPHKIEQMILHRPRPRSGAVKVTAAPVSLSKDGSFARLAVRAEDDDGPWLDLTLSEILMPKGPVGRLPAGARRDFLQGRFVEGAGLSKAEDGQSVLALADVRSSDWLPGTLERAYALRTEGEDRAREIAVKEHAGRLWRVHPRDVDVEGAQVRSGERTMAVKADFDPDSEHWRIMAAHHE